MLASLLQSMLPPGFDLEKTIAQVTDAIKTTVATVQRIETKIDGLTAAMTTALAAAQAEQAEQAATVHPLLTQGNPNDDRQQHDPAGIDHAAAGGVNARSGGNGSGDATND